MMCLKGRYDTPLGQALLGILQSGVCLGACVSEHAQHSLCRGCVLLHGICMTSHASTACKAFCRHTSSIPGTCVVPSPLCTACMTLVVAIPSKASPKLSCPGLIGITTCAAACLHEHSEEMPVACAARKHCAALLPGLRCGVVSSISMLLCMVCSGWYLLSKEAYLTQKNVQHLALPDNIEANPTVLGPQGD